MNEIETMVGQHQGVFRCKSYTFQNGKFLGGDGSNDSRSVILIYLYKLSKFQGQSCEKIVPNKLSKNL
jgi:hypothetical protein